MKSNADVVYKAKSNMNGEEITLEWHDLVGRRIPEKNWKQVHIIANYGGKVVFAYFEKLGLYNLPGGHLEEGESVDTTVRREFAEETGGLIIDWEPVGYQARTDSKGNTVYQLRVYADVTEVKEQNIDFDGSIVPTKLVDFGDILKVWGWENPIGERIADLVKDRFPKHDRATSSLRKEVDGLLEVVQPILEEHGELEFVGSFAWGTMYDRDVDISLWMDGQKLKTAQRKIMARLLEIDGVYEIKTRDLISYHTDTKGGRNLKCILIMLKMFNNDGILWNFDICMFDKNDGDNNALPFSQEVLKKIEGMTDEQKQLIIDIKKAVTDAGLYLKGRSSVDIYLKVAVDNIKSIVEYMPFAYELAGKRSGKPQDRKSNK